MVYMAHKIARLQIAQGFQRNCFSFSIGLFYLVFMKTLKKLEWISLAISVVMLLLGLLTAMALLLPLKGWIVLLCVSIIVCGILLLRD